MKTLILLFTSSVVLLLAGLLLGNGPAPLAQGQPAESRIEPALIPTETRAPPPAPLPAPVAAPQPPPSPMVEAMEADNLCAVVSQMSRSSVLTKEVLPALLRSVGASPALQELYAADGPLFGNGASPAHKLARFFQALRLGNALHYFHGEADLDRARTILLALEEEESGNAAFPLFRLDLEQRLGYSREKLRETARKAAAASYFDTLQLPELRELERSRWQSPSHHFVISAFLDSAQGINFHNAITTLQEIDREFHDQHARSIAGLMMQEGIRAARSAYFMDFSAVEYDWGRGLLNDESLPYSSMLSLQKEGRQEWPWPPYLTGGDCKREIYDDFFLKIRSLL
jgi:hypothetical protein